ncbi:MAG: DNA-processing protein DprA [Clostridia bacterium]|nr:DNA-processing protein DprA [Clostridia bacterium]
MYNENELAVIWLSLFDKLSLAKAKALMALYHQPKEILQNLYTHKNQIIDVIGEDLYYKMLATDDKQLVKSYVENLDKKNIVCLTCCSDNYPEKLLYLKDAPIILFAKGDLSLLTRKSVAIVGTRTPTAYGREIATKYAETLAKAGVVIVSGLASGVDKLAHEGALNMKGKTIAVLGGGFDCIYPAMNTNLAKTIAEKGLLLSEYRPNVFATKFTFPVRNRIIAALSDAVFLAEAGEKSGALYTKDYALEQGKPVFSVPANINNKRAAGTNKILKTHQAIFSTAPDDIIENLGLEAAPIETPTNAQISVTEQLVITALEDQNQSFEDLQAITKLETKNLNSCLTMLQIRGLIKKLPGNVYSL